jgi:antitoxin HicB
MKKKNIGSSFDSWLREEGIFEKVKVNAAKRVLLRESKGAKKKKNVPDRHN